MQRLFIYLPLLSGYSYSSLPRLMFAFSGGSLALAAFTFSNGVSCSGVPAGRRGGGGSNAAHPYLHRTAHLV